MSTLRDRNRKLLAERLGWPTDGLAACIAIEEEFPPWLVFWARGGLVSTPRPGYYAIIKVNDWTTRRAYGATPAELRKELEAADREPPR